MTSGAAWQTRVVADRILVRATINMSGVRAGQQVFVDPEGPNIKPLLQGPTPILVPVTVPAKTAAPFVMRNGQTEEPEPDKPEPSPQPPPSEPDVPAEVGDDTVEQVEGGSPEPSQ